MNQTPEVPAGTRCECTMADCYAMTAIESGHPSAHVYGKCPADAVRMVTRWSEPGEYHDHHGTRPMQPVSAEVPLCAACAEYHTAKVGAK